MSEQKIHRPTKVVFHGDPKRLTSEPAIFQVNAYKVSHGTYAGGDAGMSPELERLVFDRGHSVAALLHDPDERKVIVVEQFRLPIYGRLSATKDTPLGANEGGWIIETAAGGIKSGETAIQCLIREVGVETGYQVKDAFEIANFFPSPGGSSERIALYLAEVSKLDRDGTHDIRPLKQDSGEYEDIRVLHFDQDEFIRMLDARELKDGKLIIAGYFLKDRLMTSDRAIPKGRVRSTDYALKGSRGLKIGIRPGSMLDWEGIPVWVNSENTDMEMDRLYARSVSAAIRYSGAQRNATGRVIKDIVADELRQARGRHGHIHIANVLETGPGALKASHGVQCIMHVAAVEGAVGTGKVQFDSKDLDKCVTAVLSQVDQRNGWKDGKQAYDTVLMPLMGAGQGGGRIEVVASLIVDTAIAYLSAKMQMEAKGSHPHGIRQILLSAYSERAEMALRHILNRRPELTSGERWTPKKLGSKLGRLAVVRSSIGVKGRRR